MITRRLDKLHELILYIVERLADDSRFGKTRLAKLLFWIDFEHFRETGEAVTGSDYIKMPYGPMLRSLDGILEGMQRRGHLRAHVRPAEGFTQYAYKALRRPQADLFTPRELELIDRLIEEQRGQTAKMVSDLSHEFLGWQMTPSGERIPYGAAWLSAPPPTADEIEAAHVLAVRLGRV